MEWLRSLRLSFVVEERVEVDNKVVIVEAETNATQSEKHCCST